MYIPIAHRIGARRQGVTRQIIAKFPVAHEMDQILKQANRLRDTHHFINRQLPAAVRERNQYALPEYRQKRQTPANKAKLINGKLYVKGQLQTRFLPPCLPTVDITRDDVPQFTITDDNPIQDSGSTFIGYASEVSNVEDVAVVLDQHLQLGGVATASHRMYAYRFRSSKGKILENFESDGDEGVGMELLKAMSEANVSNRVWIATRTCNRDYKHIGKKRFEHVIASCSNANAKL